MRESLTKTMDNEQQMVMTIVTKGQGSSIRSVILLMSTGRVTNVPISDWLAENGY